MKKNMSTIMQNKIKLRLSIITIILVILLSGNLVYADKSEEFTEDFRYEVIDVKYGDTVWGIAKEYSENDIKNMVNEISKFNQLESYNIQPGDKIIVPIKS